MNANLNGNIVLQFGGQATPWRSALAEMAGDSRLTLAFDASTEKLAAVLPELTRITSGSLDLFTGTTNEAYASVPGILLAQYGALLDVDLEPSAIIGHSQGVLAVELAKDQSRAPQLLALARLIGAAATIETRNAGASRSGDWTPMMAVNGVPADVLEKVIDGRVDIAIRNTSTGFTLSGMPSALADVARDLADLAAEQAADRAAKVTGGAPLAPVTEFLDVDAPFHSHLLAPALERVHAWAQACGLTEETGLDDVDRLARAVLTDSLDWRAVVAEAIDGADWVVDLGPGASLNRITKTNVAGHGIGLVNAGTTTARDQLAIAGNTWAKGDDWSQFAPSIAKIDGRPVVETKFTKLTGRSPILLAGMTPTTVEPEIVAAAANSGYWVELAGGGQVTEAVFEENLKGLKEQLEPGRTAQFNAMFLDRYLWNLQFGTQHIVTRERISGAPLDGVVISAGIPDLEEAVELVQGLRRDGFPYVAFKPGTVGQIREVLAIARAVPEIPVLLMVEDGHAGGHHSWEDLDQLMLTTYGEIRAEANTVLCVGGGLGVPERAASFITGEWALAHGSVRMPVDGVMIGTAAMTAKEAHTNADVKELLVATAGVAPDDKAGWVGTGEVRGGVTSGLSHLRADMYEIDNAASRCARLLVEMDSDPEARVARRDEIIAALNATAKPYFGDLEKMTYAQVARRFLELTFPFNDVSWADRFTELLQRFEARLCPADYGEWPTMFAEVTDPEAALAEFLAAYPAAEDVELTPFDAAWFVELCRKYAKPVPFVPVIDDSLLRWWGTDCLWQSHDPRYTADQVRIIPGPVSVSGIRAVNEPIAEILARYEDAAIDAIGGEGPEVFSRLAPTPQEYLATVPHIVWHGHLMTNPATVTEVEIIPTESGADMLVNLDTLWDGTGATQHAVRELRIPLLLDDAVRTGGVPVVDDAKLPQAMRELLAATAGVGAPNVCGDFIEELPVIVPSNDSEFGEAHFDFSISEELGSLHAGVTADTLPESLKLASIVPSAVLGLCWPPIYAALGSAIVDDYPVIEGLLNAVHLDHTEELDTNDLAGRVHARSRCTSVTESSSGRVVVVETELSTDAGRIGSFMERFAIRGRVHGSGLPAEPPYAGGIEQEIVDTPRSLLRKVEATAPANMTAFAMVSGDYNPIHSSTKAAKVAGMDAALVHGMWLCAAAQHAVAASDPEGHSWHIKGWTYRMYGMVALGDKVEISVERIGRVRGGGLILEVTCRVNKQVVSVATVTTTAPVTAYGYPGQGIQEQGMVLSERAESPAAREVWERADAHTRKALGFSILAVVRDNPKELGANGVMHRHPEGVLNLTQFTQVALATVAFAQTEKLREAGALVEGSYLAGHSLGEYNALSAYAQIFPLETVLEIVFHRGSTMHHLVPRDEEGNSNYKMGALRPNQWGETDPEGYVASVAAASGEFLQIVNYNLEGEQYAVAGTIKGLAALAADAEARAKAAGGKRPFMLVPGIDVPFHSTVLRGGVDDFRELLDRMLPQEFDVEVLIDRYVPNLVARPFELTESFLDSILDVVPSQAVTDLKSRFSELDLAGADRMWVSRTLLVELLAWQFASPVRWIETQNVLFNAVDQFVEIGLANSPTLANMAAKTLKQARFNGIKVDTLNVQRDAKRVLGQDVAVQVADDEPEEAAAAPAASAPAEATPAAAPVAAPAPVAAASAGAAPEIEFKAADAIRALFAFATKVTPEQIGDADNVESLTNGVSSKRNQLLMDMSSELNLASIEGAAEASVAELASTVNKLAHNYKAFGPVLGDAINERIRKLFGAAGLKQGRIAERLSSTWGMGAGWVSWVTAVLLLDTREGKSTRGGELAALGDAAPTNAAGVDALIDSAVELVASRQGIAVSKASAGGAGGGAVVDSAALDAFSAQIEGTLAENAMDLLERLGRKPAAAVVENSDDAVIEAVTAELGANWPQLVTPTFAANKAVLLNDRWATAREDLARIARGEDVTANFIGTGAEISRQANWYLRGELSDDARARLTQIASDALDTTPGEYSGKVAVVTGMTPNSIGGGVVKRLLAGGATVIATASRVDQKRLLAARAIYRENARADASLWMVPANLSSYRDVDALVSWIENPVRETVGATTKEKKPAMVPDLFYPFAAPRVFGTMDNAGADTENQTRLLLWSVERMITGLAAIGTDTVVNHRLHVVLPGSPNRGLFGGDGAYGEVKAAFDAIVNKWSAEPWGARVSFAHARIGWVRGTGLMGGNDPLVAAVEAAGVHTWSTDEIADELLKVSSTEARTQAAIAPIQADLTGGLDGVDFKKLTAEMPVAAESEGSTEVTVSALPSPARVALPEAGEWDGTARPEDMVVIVGYGEAGTWGSSRTRFDAELGVQADGTFELTPAGVLELAWMMGLLTWHETPKAGWYDSSDTLVEESDIWARFHDEVVGRSGIRQLVDDGPILDGGTNDAVTVYLDRPVSFAVGTQEEAAEYVAADPEFTTVEQVDGEWMVTRKKGATALVPRRTALSRFVAGQFPTSFDPTRWGIPQTMVEGMDKMAVWNLVTTVDAFISAGFSPAELLEAVHPADVASTQGTGFGGMSSMRKLFVERFLNEDIPQDILQETLPNVIAAHTMQSYVGGYGAMIQPVGACATAAVSLEEGVDKIACGKAMFVVTGANDDLSVESLEGFGNMNATASSQALADQGINSRFFSRAGDLRRGGFVEAQGGGTILIARGDLALEMGLPVHAVVGYVQSFADGAHTSIPAPGIGALAAGRGGNESRMMRQLRALGVEADDIAVVSKHDTSTNANDPNEAELHVRLARAVGRTEGNPLHVISQKTLTGHSKGGAAMFQLAGLCQVFASGTVPANRSLDNLDPAFAEDDFLVWLRDPLKLGTIKAGLATSLGFGHVSAIMAIVHPGAFEASVRRTQGDDAAATWRKRATDRVKNGLRHFEQGMIGHDELFVPIESRRLAGDAHEVEAAMLLDPSARLGADGFFS